MTTIKKMEERYYRILEQKLEKKKRTFGFILYFISLI